MKSYKIKNSAERTKSILSTLENTVPDDQWFRVPNVTVDFFASFK